MRKSRVLLAGVAVAAAGVTTSAFTAGNTLNPLDDVAGYGELTVTGVAVSNVAYTPLASDASKLDNIVFTVDENTGDMVSTLTVSVSGAPLAAITCTNTLAGATSTVTCDVPNTVEIQTVTKVGLTVTSK
jgi:hypothetical protein